ncbi:MAG: methionyl aminopeptidase [Chlamydiota bacterium]|nr:methionyl aminopeptidase [Chlamydiota bacterium]
MERNAPCWCGSGKKWKRCHAPERAPLGGQEVADQYRHRYGILIKSEEEIAGIRLACHHAAAILDRLCHEAVEGVTTEHLNKLALTLHEERGCRPAPLGYGDPPFPGAICTSLNEVICHGIPDGRPLQAGDILNIDVTAIKGPYYGDCSAMVMVGAVSAEKARVVETSHEALHRAIARIRIGDPLSLIGETISGVAEAAGCSVVYQFVGHGTGLSFHEPPQISHHRNRDATPLAPGMTFTIEPMINAGGAEAVIDPHDQWTARTADGLPSAQWEHTLLMTEVGCEILTLL